MSHSSSESCEPNLTPMLDMVFQLITFFMLVINFKAASLDLDLTLPVIGSAKPLKTESPVDLLVLNVNKAGELRVYGNVIQDVDRYIANEAQMSTLFERRNNANFADGSSLSSTVVIRADKATPFKLLNKVIKTCQDKGFRNFSMKAMNKEETK
jgi:biopolymer transport protein ExbD